jgi:colicin import membrane protein
MSVAAGALQYQEPGRVPSVVLAVLVHVLLAVFLFFGVRWQSSQPDAVMVELWVSPPVTVAERVEPKPAIKPPPIPEPEVKPPPQVEAPKPDIALEKKKEPKKEPPKKEPPKTELPKKEAPKLNLDFSKEIQAQAEREITDVRTNQDRDRTLTQMKRDGAASAARADAAYIGKLKGKIRSNVVLPPDIPGNPEAIFDVVQLPTGEVMSVKLRKSSGNKAYDAAVERAILKSSPLPKPDRPEQFQPSLEIKFRPLE